ncbi:MAG: U32 family peptidase C-terminal domain-containing protein [Calditrichaceae bacterium]
MKIPELLAPAGTFEKMEYAFAYGADAVYAGVPKFSLRVRENDFDAERLAQAIDYAHKLGKKIYLTMNIFPHNRKVKAFLNMLAKVAEMKPDGLIMADPGMILAARENHPELDIHLSTQANTINWQSVRFWKNAGVKRIILSREINLDEIKEIKQHVPEMELESFVHGAICIAYSGRCLLSNYFTHRDANQGSCTNACRWEYKVYSEEKDINETSYFLEETERPGSLMPVDEDEHGTYIMNAKDLCAIEILDQMADAGIDSFKIEGRTKSIYYLSIITRAYRRAIDQLKMGGELSPEIIDEVYSVANRGYITGFLEGNPQHRAQNYEQSHSGNQTRTYTGIIKEWNAEKNLSLMAVRGRFEKGDQLELVTPESTIPFKVEALYDRSMKSLDTAHPGGKDVLMGLPIKPPGYSLIRRVKIC